VFERFSPPARAVVTGAVAEAERHGDHRVGTDHLLLGLLRQPATPAARALGVDLDAARAGRDALDRTALAAVGLDLGPEPTTGGRPPTEPTTSAKGWRGLAHRPFTAGARHTLARTLAVARADGSRTLSTEHLLLALLDARRPDAALTLLDELGVVADRVRERLRRAA
jgi:hypothetical protein